MELCRILNRTPSEIGELRRTKPMDIRFLEMRINKEWKDIIERNKEHERKMKASQHKPRSRIGR